MIRLWQVIKYGWRHSAQMIPSTGNFLTHCMVFVDMLYCFFIYKMWSTQYLKEKFYYLSNKGILKVKDYLFTFLSNPSVPYDNNASERGVRKIKIKQKVSGCFRTGSGADDFAKLHSIVETAMMNGNSKFNAILAVVQQ